MDISADHGTAARSLMSAIDVNNLEEVRRLLKDPCIDINCRCMSRGTTPFGFACERGNVEIVRLFLGCKRFTCHNPHRRVNTGFNAAMWMLRIDVIELLLRDSHLNVNAPYGSSHLTQLIYDNSWRVGWVKLLALALASDRLDPNTQVNERDRIDFRAANALLAVYNADPIASKQKLREELGGYPEYQPGELFAIVVLLCDNYLEIK